MTFTTLQTDNHCKDKTKQKIYNLQFKKKKLNGMKKSINQKM